MGDINNDGLIDIYLVGNLVNNALFLNRGNFKFENITENAGVAGRQGWATGVTMVDINSDGFLDIYVSRSGKLDPDKRANELFINQGDETFLEQASKYGLDDSGYGTQAVFFDYDLDGDVDLFQLNHQISQIEPKKGSSLEQILNTRSPEAGDRLYRNDGGSFVDVSAEAGIIGNSIGYGLGVAVADLNQDAWPDIYVCNDFMERDYLYINNQKGGFREVLKTSLEHLSQFSMGVDAADFNNDGLIDIFVADMAPADNYRQKTMMKSMNIERFRNYVDSGLHYQYMYNTLQLNNGNGHFSEIGQLAGVAKTDWSWAPLFVDLDNDGNKDLIVSNGRRKDASHVDFRKRKEAFALKSRSRPQLLRSAEFKELLEAIPENLLANQVFKNNGSLQFSNVSTEWGLDAKANSTGMAYGDLDNDGDLDLVLNNIDEATYVYRNNSRDFKDSNYLRVKLSGPHGNPLGIGARVEITTAESSQTLEQYLSRGYQSSVDPVLHFGLGSAKTIDEIVVRWPDGTIEKQKNIGANQLLSFSHKPKTADERSTKEDSTPYLKDVTESSRLDFVHKENSYDDYDYELLLPHRLSTLGPALASADINGDGLDDLYIGGARGQSGAVYIQQADSTFKRVQGPWSKDAKCEDLGAVFFDADGDQDLDLYVSSGGNEASADDASMQDRLYLNDGTGQFEKAHNKLPKMQTSSMAVAPADFDGDGDVDLFVGGRLVPKKYPYPPRSYLLENVDGVFKDATEKLAPALRKPGMVTAAKWSDLNNDKLPDLIVVGEWMSIIVLLNEDGKLADASDKLGLGSTQGWWSSIAVADFDADGDQDIVVGNQGLNYKHKAKPNKPFRIYADDFDNNGKIDIVLSYESHGEYYPARGRECSSQQMPFIRSKFKNYDTFARARLADVYEPQKLEEALSYNVSTFASSYFENRGKQGFSMKPLPVEAQFSMVSSVIPLDINNDSKLDLLIAGNRYEAEIETPRSDASIGYLFLGSGSGDFTAVPPLKSGVYLPGNIKSGIAVSRGNAKPVFIFARSDGRVSAISPP